MRQKFLRAVAATVLLAAPVLATPAPASADRATDLAAQAVCTMLAMGAQDCGPFTR